MIQTGASRFCFLKLLSILATGKFSAWQVILKAAQVKLFGNACRNKTGAFDSVNSAFR